MAWLPGLAGLGVLVLLLLGLLLFLARSWRHRLPGEPPLDKGLIPWVGHAVEFGKDPAKFLFAMKQKYGDIFTFAAGGKFITFLLDPFSYDVVLWESPRKLDFGQYARLLMDRMFDLQLPDYDRAAEEVMLRATLQGKNLPSLTKAMFFNLRTVLLSDPSKANQDWKEESLFQLAYSTMLRAGYLTLYGNESPNYEDASGQTKDLANSLEVYNEFFKLDRLLMKAARGMLNAEEKKECDSFRKNLWKLLNVKSLRDRANRSVWLESYLQLLADLNVDEDMQTRAMLLQLWSTQGNAGPATFWLLLFLLKHPSAWKAVQGEVEGIFRNRTQTMGQTQMTNQEVLDKTPIFDSVLNETLRMEAAPFISREVLQNMLLRLASGTEYSLRKGDRLCLFPYVSPQMDCEIYEEPQKFIYNRFLNADGTEKTDFYKGGKKLKYYNMPWGAGVNICIGKLFAVNGIKQFIFLLLHHFDLELKDPNGPMPGVDKQRYGFGVLQPENDVIVRYRRKAQ